MTKTNLASFDAGLDRMPGIVLGVGLGGFVDGILLHQILQWHHLVCETPDCLPTSIDSLMLAGALDGLFHAFTWMVTLVGVWLAYRAAARKRLGSPRFFAGSLILGWGIFNLVEGLVNHHILQIHHVRPGPNQVVWDLGFLAFSVVLLAAGWWMARANDGYVSKA